MVIPEDKWFYFASGRKASSIEELKQALEGMDEGEFRHHVNNEKNDFASWVEGVFQEKDLAKSMREVSEKDGLIIILEGYLEEKEASSIAPEQTPQIKKIIPSDRKLHEEIEEQEEQQAEFKEEQVPKPEKERVLSHREIKSIVEGAKHVFAELEHRKAKKEDALKPMHHHLVLKEFIYGFILGLIFGLIMLGIIFNLKY